MKQDRAERERERKKLHLPAPHNFLQKRGEPNPTSTPEDDRAYPRAGSADLPWVAWRSAAGHIRIPG